MQTADTFLGLFDGILISATFPDALSIALSRAWYDLALQLGRTDLVPGRIDPIPASTLPVPGGATYRSAVWPWRRLDPDRGRRRHPGRRDPEQGRSHPELADVHPVDERL